MERMAKPRNELEGLIRDRLPDIIRRHLKDVQIDRIDRDGDGPNWIGMHTGILPVIRVGCS